MENTWKSSLKKKNQILLITNGSVFKELILFDGIDKKKHTRQFMSIGQIICYKKKQ